MKDDSPLQNIVTGIILLCVLVWFVWFVSEGYYHNRVIARARDDFELFFRQILIFALPGACLFGAVKCFYVAYTKSNSSSVDNDSLFVKLVKTEWTKAFFVGLASSICASFIMLLLTK